MTSEARDAETAAPAWSLARVAVVGGRAWGGLTASVVRGFAGAGTRVTLVPYANWRHDLYRPSIRGSSLVSRPLAALERPVAEARLVAAIRAQRPDLVLFVKTDDLHGWVYRALRRVAPSAVLAAFHPDDPFRLDGHGGASHRRALVQMRHVDAYFLWSRALCARAAAAGARRVSYLPFASDPELHHPVEVDERDRATYGGDVCFVGNWDPEREAWLRHLGSCDLAIWGNGYWATRCRDPVLRRRWRGRELVGEEMAKAARASRINLNVLRIQNKGACNMRTFELPACGGFMLHERSADLPALFRPGAECDDFGSAGELVEKVRYWLAPERDAARAALAQAGLRAARRQTYASFAERVLRAVGGAGPARPGAREAERQAPRASP
jgi:spore maturation protein CgeB